jgi:hypothetical protein
MTDRCIEPGLGEKLGAYELGLLDTAQRRDVEAHLVACEACRDEAYATAPVATLITGDAVGVVREMDRPPTPARTPWRESLRALVRSPRALVPAAAVAVVALVVLTRSPDPAAVARVEPLPWTPLAVRDASRPADALFERAMARYAEGDWAAAAAMLRDTLAESDAPLAGTKREQAMLYLGVSLLMLEDPAAAIAPLEGAAGSALPVLADRALWYLAQARLLGGERAAARAILARLQQSPGYAAAAADQLRRLE